MTMTEPEVLAENTAAARRVLEVIFPANDEDALLDALDTGFVNHEAPAGTPPGPASAVFYMHMISLLSTAPTAVGTPAITSEYLPPEGLSAIDRCTSSGCAMVRVLSTGRFATTPP
jgi:hypothetical protein